MQTLLISTGRKLKVSNTSDSWILVRVNCTLTKSTSILKLVQAWAQQNAVPDQAG